MRQVTTPVPRCRRHQPKNMLEDHSKAPTPAGIGEITNDVLVIGSCHDPVLGEEEEIDFSNTFGPAGRDKGRPRQARRRS